MRPKIRIPTPIRLLFGVIPFLIRLIYRGCIAVGDVVDKFVPGKILSKAVILPSVVLLIIFVYGFIGYTARESTTNSNALQQLRRLPAQNVNLQNYEELFTGQLNSRFRVDVVNTIFFTVMFIVVCLVVGLALAMLLDQRIRGESIFRTIFLFPMALSFVVTGVVWKWLFNPTSGINWLPSAVGLPAGQFQWFISEGQWLQFHWGNIIQIALVTILGLVLIGALWRWLKTRSVTALLIAALLLLVNSWITLAGAKQLALQPTDEIYGFNVALIAVVVAAGWQMSGYTMAMYLAGLRGVSDELREAARVDGATEIGVYRYVIWPLLKPITLSAMIILGHISLKIFDLVYTMGGGGNLYIDMPGINMWLTTFRSNDFGKGAAIAMIMLIMVAVVIIPYLWSSMREEVEL